MVRNLFPKIVEHKSQSQYNEQPPAQLRTESPLKKSISAASVFRQQPRRLKKVAITAKPAVDHAKVVDEDALGVKSEGLKSRSSSQSPRKSHHRVSKKASDMHPLAIAFKDTSDDYRRHLYESATVKINSTLKILLNKLYEGTLQPIDSTPNDNQTSPIRLTVPAKFEREALKLYQPISAYQVRLTRTNSDGERVPFMSTLEKRMFDYEAYVATQKVEIEEIRKNWLIVVGEIWKLGVHCLGESFMESMLFTGKETHQPSSSPEETESAFFVPEQDPSPPPRTRRSNKRVTFEMPETGDELMGGKSKALDFLYQSSRLSHQPLPVMPKQKIAGIEKQVKGLGKKEIEDYQKAEKDYKVYWQLKVAKLKEALEED